MKIREIRVIIPMKNKKHDSPNTRQIIWRGCHEKWRRQTSGNRGTQSLQVLWQMPGDGWVAEEDNKKMNPKALLLGFLFLFQEGIKAMREQRIYKNETVYYITVRTNNRELLFQDQSDYEFFVEALKGRKEKYGFKLYAYCLLNNHYHLLIEPLEGANISKIMQALNTSYTLYFNKKYNRTGHLVGGRFESRLLNKDNALLKETMYIHLNPLLLNSSDNYRDYPWSSYNEYIGRINSGLIEKQYILSFLNLADEQAVKNKYSELITEEASKKEHVRHSEGGLRLTEESQVPDYKNRFFSFRPRFALTLVLLLVLFQFLAPRKTQQGYKYNNSNDFSLKNYASLVLPKYSGETKPQEKLVWELWKLGPRE